jgi:hypothetical protein
VRRRLGAPDASTTLVLAFGRLVEKKGFRYLVEAAARLPGAHLAIAGEGSLRRELEALARDLHVSVTFTGALERTAMAEAVLAADIIAVPSVVDRAGNVDGLPNTLLEALGAGRAVVASRVAGIPDVVEDGVTGLLVPPQDPGALADALRRLAGDATGPTPQPVPRGADRTATIVLLSDGQNNQFPAPQQVVEDAVTRGIRIFTVGVGSSDGTIVRIQGRAVRTRLDEATLKQIADATGGQYFNAANEKDLRAVYENLTTQLVFRQQRTEITAFLTAIAAVLSILAAALSLAWFNRIP